MTTTILNSCCFCDELASGSNNDYARIFGGVHAHRIIANTSSLVLLPSLGPITEGHLLLLPKVHLNSFAELEDELRIEAIGAIDEVKEWLSDRLGPLVLFEHGTARGALTGACGITHAHIHFVPVGMTKISLPIAESLAWNRIDELDYLSAIRTNGGDETGYLFFVNESGERYFSLTSSAPSQFMRRHVASALGSSSWNWRDNASDDRALKPLKWTRRSHDTTHLASSRYNLPAGL